MKHNDDGSTVETCDGKRVNGGNCQCNSLDDVMYSIGDLDFCEDCFINEFRASLMLIANTNIHTARISVFENEVSVSWEVGRSDFEANINMQDLYEFAKATNAVKGL